MGALTTDSTVFEMHHPVRQEDRRQAVRDDEHGRVALSQAAEDLRFGLYGSLAHPLEGLARDGQLMARPHDGFWAAMDTLRDKNTLEALWTSGEAPWKLWK